MNLDELARSAAGTNAETFSRRFPHPALVFVSTSASAPDEPKVDTPSGGIKLPGKDVSFSRTSAFKATDAFPAVKDALQDMIPEKGTGSAKSDILGTSLVVFLQKSNRNPFESMITIGRATNNDHCLPLPTVSKVHAYFSKAPDGSWRLTDQRATNGTWVDGLRLEAGGNAPLNDGSRIGFGPDARARFFTAAGLHGFLALYRSGIAV